MRTSITIRWTTAILFAGILALALPKRAHGQDDPNEAPLGDVARSFRKKIPAPEVVIDNDNFSKVVEEAESRRAAGATAIFLLDPANNHLPAPDVSCSFSFNARASSLTDQVVLDELPRSEVAKLDGPAMIDGDQLEVSMHNATGWELREVVIGLTILRRPAIEASASYGSARIVPAASSAPLQDSFQKQPDVTVLLRVKGSAAPSATAVFRTQLNFALFPDQEWHWAIVRAKGLPPQPADSLTTQLGQVSSPPTAPPAPTAGSQIGPLNSVPSPAASSPDVAVH
ncbi:MAG: hypothetical protein WAL56_15580 [Candidatus Sulfotelmatobacter sp.]